MIEAMAKIIIFPLKSNNMNRFAHISAITLLLASCSASGAKFQDSPFATQPVAGDKGRVIFYRESDANFRSATLGIDGAIVGALAHEGFIVADTAPGNHKVSVWVRGVPIWEFAISMSIVTGEVYYIRVSQRAERMLYPLWGIFGVALLFADSKGEFQLEPVPAAIALVDLEELKLSE